MPLELSPGYENMIRTKLGVKDYELPNEDINQPNIIGLAKAYIEKRVPDADKASDKDKIFIESAVVSYACYLLAPGMPRRLNTDVTTADVRWKKDSVDWMEMAQVFLDEVNDTLSQIESVPVAGYDSQLFVIAKAGDKDAG